MNKYCGYCPPKKFMDEILPYGITVREYIEYLKEMKGLSLEYIDESVGGLLYSLHRSAEDREKQKEKKQMSIIRMHDIDYISRIRESIVRQYEDNPTGTGYSFDEILCHEIHENGLTFNWLAEKWGISVTVLGELIKDHCMRLEKMPKVNHDYRRE